ncbi:hypothetical protein MKX03_022889 [Papaver bracteatum]|nr:hypothetical protein MKX03_022889 [Papaver bracteatum]
MRRTRASSQGSSSSSSRLSTIACEEPSVPIQVASSTSSSAVDDTFPASQDEYFYGQHQLTDDDDSSCHCPYKFFDNFHDGVCDGGYAKSSISRHIKDMHFHGITDIVVCMERIRTEAGVHLAWEKLLRKLHMWMCFPFRKWFSWRRPCRDHPGGVLPGPFNERGADLWRR